MSKFASERDEPRDLHGFEEVLEAARVDSLSPEDMDNYQDMLDAVKIEARKADLYDRQQAEARAAEAEARGEARGEARAEARTKAEMAKALKELGVKPDTISRASGLSKEEIAAL